MVADLGSTMIHCFTPEMREKMNIEGIWGESEDVN
jgi:ribosomal silencing factor RsfS